MCTTNYDYAKIYRESRPVARKLYTCYECARAINPGEKYQYVFSIWDWDSKPTIFRTCPNCLVAQDWLLKECDGFMHGGLYEEILEHAQEYRKMFLYRWVVGIRRKWGK